MPKGRIIKIISNRYTVLTQDGQRLIAIAMGKMRLKQSPIVGDWVEIEQFSDKWGMQSIYPRNNELIRPLIANVDQAVILASLVRPDFSATLLDRLLFLIAYAEIKPVIVITKCDLIDANDPVFDIIKEYEVAGYEVLKTGKNWSTHEIEKMLANKVSVLTGQSGAGKSSLINRIDPEFKLITQETSKALGRGKHTTRHVELHEVAKGWVADTPGFSSLDFSILTTEELSWLVFDFKPYLGQCKFRNCIHQNEPGCEIKHRVDTQEISKTRYQNYLDCLQLIEQGGK